VTPQDAAAVYHAAVVWQEETRRLYLRYNDPAADRRALDAAVSEAHMGLLDALTGRMPTDDALKFYDLVRERVG
jgi:hypothetical protein